MFSESSCSARYNCKMRKFVTRQPCWDQLRKYQAPPTSRSTANRNALSLKWPVIGQSLLSRARCSKVWKQSHEEEQKSSFLSEHLNYNMLKGYYGIFAHWCQKFLQISNNNILSNIIFFCYINTLHTYYTIQLILFGLSKTRISECLLHFSFTRQVRGQAAEQRS